MRLFSIVPFTWSVRFCIPPLAENTRKCLADVLLLLLVVALLLFVVSMLLTLCGVSDQGETKERLRTAWEEKKERWWRWRWGSRAGDDGRYVKLVVGLKHDQLVRV